MATLADVIAEMVREAIGKAIEDKKAELHNIAVAGGDAAAGGIMGDIGRLTGLLSDVGLLGNLLADVVDPFNSIIGAVDDNGGRMGRAFGLGYIGGYLLYQQLNPFVLPVTHAINDLTQNEIFDPQTAADLAARGLITKEYARSEAAGGGFDGTHADLLERAAEIRPGVPEQLTLWNRGLVGENLVDAAMGLEKISSDWREPLKQLRFQILSGADLALAQLRGDITPEDATSRAAQAGWTAENFQLLIGNTGEPPGTQQLLEAFRRQFIDQATLERGIRQSRVRDEWIPTIVALRHERMSVADVVRATVENYITPEEGKARAEVAGLDPEDWPIVFESWGEPISRTEALELLHRGVMTQAEVEQAIRESRVKDKYIPDILALGRRLIPYRTISTIIAHGVKDTQWGITYLMQLGYTQDDAEALVATATSAKISKTKGLSESQVSELYQSGSITRAEAEQLLQGHGYNQAEAGYALEVWSAQNAIRDQRQAVSTVRAAFLKGAITKQTASNDLDRIGVVPAERDQVIKDWEIEISTRVKTLSAAQVAAAVFYGIWTEKEGVEKLIADGYSENDAKVLIDIRLHGIPKGESVGQPTTPG